MKVFNVFKRRKMLFVFAVVLLILVPSLVFLNMWANAPVSSTVNLSATSATAKLADNQTQTITTPYFRVEVPNSWRVQRNPTADRLQIVAIAPTGDQLLAIASSLLPGDQLAGVPDYKLRKSDSSHYAPYQDSAFPAGSEAFQTVTGAAEYTLFLKHNDRYASLNVSGGASGSTLLDLLKNTLPSWQWK